MDHSPQALVVLPLLLLLLLLPAPAESQVTEYERWYESLRDAPSQLRGASRLVDVTLERDGGRFRFDSGELHFLTGPDSVTYGAVFLGQGRFSLHAPDPLEARMIREEFEVDSLVQPFRSAVFLFTGNGGQQLDNLATEGGTATATGGAGDAAEDAIGYITDGDGWIAQDLALPLVNGGPGLFYVHMVDEDDDDPTIFRSTPYDHEEVTLYRRADSSDRRRTVASFHRASDYVSGRSVPQEALDILRISDYDITTRIHGNLELEGQARVRFSRMAARHEWVPFVLHSELELDSIVGADGEAVRWYRAEDRSTVWTHVADRPGEDELTFFYEGRIMERVRDFWVVMDTYRTWYPVHEFDRPIRYRLTFETPDEYQVATVGKLVEEFTEDGRVTRIFESDPVRLVAFNMGDFETHTTEPADGVPPITVQVSENAHNELGAMAMDAGVFLLQQGDMAGSVARDLSNSYRFFQDAFGPVPGERLLATEIPTGHGEAYPGLTLLSWSTFRYTTEKGFDEMFRAHEMAHQWWGIGVRPATDRDRWLAEGFSEFAGWWYAARARGSAEMYMERLEVTREELEDRRGEAKPIALGSRVDAEDYESVIYHKGAWVLHMLRTLLTDPNTGDDSAFQDLMRGFYQDHLGGSASTAHFEAAVTRAAGVDMSWFFDQWVRGSDIPTYRWAHTFEDQPDGTVRATVRIRQEEVPDDFRMIVPILVDFGDEGTALVRVDVRGPVTEVDLPLLPRRPDDIQLNPHESVLAEVHDEGWE